MWLWLDMWHQSIRCSKWWLLLLLQIPLMQMPFFSKSDCIGLLLGTCRMTGALNMRVMSATESMGLLWRHLMLLLRVA